MASVDIVEATILLTEKAKAVVENGEEFGQFPPLHPNRSSRFQVWLEPGAQQSEQQFQVECLGSIVPQLAPTRGYRIGRMQTMEPRRTEFKYAPESCRKMRLSGESHAHRMHHISPHSATCYCFRPANF